MEEKIEFKAWGIVLDVKKLQNNVTEYTTLVIVGTNAMLIPIHVTGESKIKKGQFVYFDIEKNIFKEVDAKEIHKEIIFEVIKELLVKDSKGIVKPNVDTDIRDFCTAVTMRDTSWAHKCIINWDSQTVNYLKNMFFSDYNHSQANTR